MYQIAAKNVETLNEKEEIKRKREEYIAEIYASGEKPRKISMGVEEEYKVHEDQNVYSILKIEVNEAIKMMRKEKAEGCDEIPIELFKAPGEMGELLLLDLCNEILEGKWPEDFRDTMMIPIEKKRNTKKCEEDRTISLISHAAKVLLRVLNKRIYNKLDGSIEE
ncbi:uncharacterized protein LOC142319852 [Lycorma delicatula]|uniref:uncharacterized protein LOC142319852 n=1 Tax=Lycorma delicatula TaxID=130591 RepID=UPI003F51260E